MSDMSSSSSLNNEIQTLLEEQDEIIDELIENIDDLNIDIQKIIKSKSSYPIILLKNIFIK